MTSRDWKADTENTLKLALDEAKLAADKLNESLQKDIASVYKLLDEQDKSWFQKLIGGHGDIATELGGETGFGGFRAKIADLTDSGALTDAYKAEIARLQKQLSDAQHPASIVTAGAFGERREIPVAPNQKQIELLNGAIRNLQASMASIGLKGTDTALNARKNELLAGRAEDEQAHPFESRIQLLDAQIAAVKAKLEAAGKPEAAQIIARAFGEAQIAIAETNKALERHGAILTEAGEQQIRDAELKKASIEAETQWRDKFAASTVSIEDRIAATDALTASIGKGYEATKQANIESRLMQLLSANYGDSAFASDHADYIARQRAGFGSEFDSQRSQQTAQTIASLQDEITLERALAAAQQQGAEAVREATLAVTLQRIARDNDAESAKKLMAAEIERFNAQRANSDAGELAKLQQQIEATDRLTAATLKGAAAVRQATLENKFAAAEREDGAHPGMILGPRAVGAVQEDALRIALRSRKRRRARTGCSQSTMKSRSCGKRRLFTVTPSASRSSCVSLRISGCRNWYRSRLR